MSFLFNESDPRPIKAILEHTSLKPLIQKAFFLIAIEKRICSLLPDSLHNLQVLNLKKGCLILATRSSALATYLRFREEELLAQLNAPSVWKIQCLVRQSNRRS